MVAHFLVQNSASQASLSPGDHHPALKSKISIYSVANAMRKKKSPQSSPTHFKNYMKAHGPCTLSLDADHEADSGHPVFFNGSVLSGSLEISKISKVLHSIEIMVVIATGAPAVRGQQLTLFPR